MISEKRQQRYKLPTTNAQIDFTGIPNRSKDGTETRAPWVYSNATPNKPASETREILPNYVIH